jgi:WD40 repeat protein
LYNVFTSIKGVDYNALRGHEGSVQSIAFLPNRNIFYSTGADGDILRWDLNQISSKPQVLIHNTFSNSSLAISSTGRWLACGTRTSIIQIFNLNQPNTPPEFIEAHKGAVDDLEFVEGKDILISTGSDKTVMYWNLLNGDKRTIVTHATRIRAIALSKDGNYVYGGTDDGQLIRWTITSGDARVLYEAKGQGINAIAVNSTGSRLAIGDKSGNIIIFDAASARKLAQIKGHNARIQDISYSPDNSLLATSSYDGTIRIWNASKLSDSPVVITEHESWALAVAFSPDGRTLVTSCQKGDIYYWATLSKYYAEQVCGNVSRNFTDQEWDIYVGMDIDYQRTCSNIN